MQPSAALKITIGRGHSRYAPLPLKAVDRSLLKEHVLVWRSSYASSIFITQYVLIRINWMRTVLSPYALDANQMWRSFGHAIIDSSNYCFVANPNDAVAEFPSNLLRGYAQRRQASD